MNEAGGRVEVLIPHHSGRESLRLTLDSLARQTREAGICVIDNASGDGSREMLSADFPGVRVVEFAANRGFGAALNAGARSSEADTVVFLNNDAEADPRFVEELAAACEHGAAAAGCLRLADGSIDTAGVLADQSLIAYDHLHGAPYPPPAGAEAPLGPCGGAAAYRRDAFLALGGFDEAFFAYLEDVDLAIRMRRAGHDCVAAPGGFAWHRHAGSLGAGSDAKNRLLGAGRARLLWKYGQALPLAARLRGHAIDGVTYAGQIALDRNAGAARGRLAERRRDRGPRPEASLDGVPLLEVGTLESLRQRWSRGRRYRGAGN